MSRDTLLGIGLVTFALAALAGLVVYMVDAHAKPKIALDADGCPSQPVGHHLVLIDGTDRWPLEQAHYIRARVRSIAAHLHVGERLTLAAITDLPSASARPFPLPQAPAGFQRCRTTNADDSSIWTQNPRQLRARHEQEFVAPLNRALDAILAPSQYATSPIIEAIDAALASPAMNATVAQRSLTIFSDFVQRSNAVRQSKPSPDPCKFIHTALMQRLGGHQLSRIDMHLEFLRNHRDAVLQSPAHRQWWLRLLALAGARSITVNGATYAPPSKIDCSPSALPQARNPKRGRR